MNIMSTVDAIMSQIHRLSTEEQSALFVEFSREMLARRFGARANGPETELPVSDAELNQLVHEARRETLRAHGL
jgi:hypothetical protein